MFFKLKQDIMCKALEKRNKESPFNPAYAENYTLEGATDPFLNNSYYFSAHSDKMSVFARLGRRVNMDESWFCVCLDGVVHYLQQEVFPAGESPLKVQKTGDSWSVSFEGKLNGKEEARFRATFSAKHPPVDFTCDMPAIRMATGIANEKWSRSYFNELQNVSGQCHYEQEGMLEGTLVLDGREMDFCLPCVRDHSFGKRDWNYMNNHLWLMAVSPELQMNYSLVSYPAMSVLEVGNFRDESGQHFLREANLDFQQINKGTIPQELSFELSMDDGRTIPVKAKVLGCVSYHFQDGEYILHENVAEYNIGGKSCRGILEIGFNRDGSRFFNHRDLTTFKR
jgi:hypothetical protein